MEAPPGAWKLQTVLEKMRLSRHEISEAAEVVNWVVEHLLRRLQGGESEFKGVALLRTGSYYERVKVSFPTPLRSAPHPQHPTSQGYWGSNLDLFFCGL